MNKEQLVERLKAAQSSCAGGKCGRVDVDQSKGITMKSTKDCYGTLFPDLNQLETNNEVKGIAFRISLRQHGLGPVQRESHVDLACWQACQACEDYRACYELSLGKVFLHMALKVCS